MAIDPDNKYDAIWCTCDDVECPMCDARSAIHLIGCPGAAHGMCLTVNPEWYALRLARERGTAAGGV